MLSVLLIIIILILLFGADKVKETASNLLFFLMGVLILLCSVLFLVSVYSGIKELIEKEDWKQLVIRLSFYLVLMLIGLTVLYIKRKRKIGEKLYWATTYEKADEVALLLKKGANANYKNDRGWSVLHTAVDSGNVEIVKLLLNYGANPNTANVFGDSPLLSARFMGYDEIEYFLTKAGAKETPLSSNSMMLVSCAVYNNTEGVMRCIKAGYNPNAVSQSGNPVLIEAIQHFNLKMVRALLEAGADPNIKGYSGRPLEIASRYVYDKSDPSEANKIVKLLKYHGAY